jgi:hypothetical protein
MTKIDYILSEDDQNEILKELKKIRIIDLNESERESIILFVSEKFIDELAIEYYVHILDNQTSKIPEIEKISNLVDDANDNNDLFLAAKELKKLSIENVTIEFDAIIESFLNDTRFKKIRKMVLENIENIE